MSNQAGLGAWGSQQTSGAGRSSPTSVNGKVEVPAGGQVQVPTPRGLISSRWGALLSGFGLAHAVGLTAGDDGGGVAQEPVGGVVLGQEPAQAADGGGGARQEPAPSSKDQCETMPGARRSRGRDEPERQLRPGVVQRREADRRGAELLLQVLTEREEKNSIAIASNQSFSGWTDTFTDPRLNRPGFSGESGVVPRRSSGKGCGQRSGCSRIRPVGRRRTSCAGVGGCTSRPI